MLVAEEVVQYVRVAYCLCRILGSEAQTACNSRFSGSNPVLASTAYLHTQTHTHTDAGGECIYIYIHTHKSQSTSRFSIHYLIWDLTKDSLFYIVLIHPTELYKMLLGAQEDKINFALSIYFYRN